MLMWQTLMWQTISPASPASFDPGRTTALMCLKLGHACNQLWTKNILHLRSLYVGFEPPLVLAELKVFRSDRPVLRPKAPDFMLAFQVENLACLNLYPLSQAAGDYVRWRVPRDSLLQEAWLPDSWKHG